MLACDNCGKELGKKGEVYEKEEDIGGYRCKKCGWLTEAEEGGLGEGWSFDEDQ